MTIKQWCLRSRVLFVLFCLFPSCRSGSRVDTAGDASVPARTVVERLQNRDRPASGFGDTLDVWLKYRIDDRLVDNRAEYRRGFQSGHAGPPGLVDGSADFNLGHSDGMRARTGYLSPEDVALDSLRQQLRSGTPEEKETVLDAFMRDFHVELVPDVIEAILDSTESPRHGDTGWARIHHQAATALSDFARKFDGVSLKERGRFEYSFYDDGGVGTEERRRQVYANWRDWWREHKTAIIRRYAEMQRDEY